MKSKEELNALKEEVEKLGEKLKELSEDELKEVTGGICLQRATENEADSVVPLKYGLLLGESPVGDGTEQQS